MARAYASQLAEADLRTLLEELQPHVHYAYQEGATWAAWTAAPGMQLAPDVVRGRVFGARCDIQFRREDDGYAVTILTDIPRAASGLAESLDLADLDTEDVAYLLWGRHDAESGTWLEPGYRQRWRYPVEGAPARVAVRAIEYRDREGAQLQFVRYLDLVAVEDAG